jgi:hypothetical protein
MSSASAVVELPVLASAPARTIIYLGMDVHKESITIAVLPTGAKSPTRLERLPNDLPKLQKWLDRVARDGEIRACDEASGAGYVLHRALTSGATPARSSRRRSFRNGRACSASMTSATRRISPGSTAPASSSWCGFPAKRTSACAMSCAAARRFSANFSRSSQVAALHPAILGAPRFRVSRRDELVQAAPRVATTSDDGTLGARARGSVRLSRVSRLAHVQVATPRRARSPNRTARTPPVPRADGQPPAVLPRHRVTVGDGARDGDRRLASL